MAEIRRQAWDKVPRRSVVPVLAVSSALAWACGTTASGAVDASGGADESAVLTDDDSPSVDALGAPVPEAAVDSRADAEMGGEAGADARSEVGPLPSCAWPASLNSMDASAGQCVAARTVVSFRQTAGGQVVGFGSSLSNDPSAWGYSQCWMECAPTEYGAQCGSSASPPAGCRQGSSFPAAYPNLYCCPCGAPGDAGDGG